MVNVLSKFIFSLLLMLLFVSKSYSQANFFNKNLSEVKQLLKQDSKKNKYELSGKLKKDSNTGLSYYEVLEINPKTSEIKRVFYFDVNSRCVSYKIVSDKKDMEDVLFVYNYYLITIDFNKKWRDEKTTYIIGFEELKNSYVLTYSIP